ncbi:unnamed protein product [Amoebophrya sp. A120]|nr:unnamed protein product [Amoebophrya sp. A120]CAD7975595.1 unnamed protein product [Amoebophrya sp. A120]|eukprot:GSA120T00013178001.1
MRFLVSGMSRTKLRLRFMGTRALFTPSTSTNSMSFSAHQMIDFITSNQECLSEL